MKNKKCYEKKCITTPVFNYPTEIGGLYCYNHKLETMIDVVNKTCLNDNCTKQPGFNFSTEKQGLYCADHKLENMINVVNKKCLTEGCSKLPNFNLPTEKQGLYCKDHKTKMMIDVTHPKCIKNKCLKRANFNYSTEIQGVYCKDHKKMNMTDVTHPKCIEKGCLKRPGYNLPTENVGIYCKDHKKDNMLDIANRHKRCHENECTTRAVFNLPTETRGLYCKDHKKEAMIDVVNKKCLEEKCGKRAHFNLPTENGGLYCEDHKKDYMIHIGNKTCQHSSCKDLATYGLPHKRSQFCETHKTLAMVNTIESLKCDQLGCQNTYEFTLNDFKFCLQHCPKEYEDTLKRKCKYCDIDEAIPFVCKGCYQKQHKKEWMVVRYIKKHIDTPFIHDSSIMLQDCSRKRPDIYYELDKHCVIVEVDEDQHLRYHSGCECARVNEIVNGIGGKSVVIIRFNPDSIYNNKKRVHINLKERLDQLVDVVKLELENNYDHYIIKLIQLYYNDDYEEYQEIKEENITTLVTI